MEFLYKKKNFKKKKKKKKRIEKMKISTLIDIYY